MTGVGRSYEQLDSWSKMTWSMVKKWFIGCRDGQRGVLHQGFPGIAQPGNVEETLYVDRRLPMSFVVFD